MFRKRADVAQCQRSTEFGPFHLDADAEILFRGSEPVALGRRATALLRVLLERPGRAGLQDALIEAAWPGLAVEDSNLTVQIGALRRALAQEARRRRLDRDTPAPRISFQGRRSGVAPRPSKATSMQPTSRATTFRPANELHRSQRRHRRNPTAPRRQPTADTGRHRGCRQNATRHQCRCRTPR